VYFFDLDSGSLEKNPEICRVLSSATQKPSAQFQLRWKLEVHSCLWKQKKEQKVVHALFLMQKIIQAHYAARAQFAQDEKLLLLLFYSSTEIETCRNRSIF